MMMYGYGPGVGWMIVMTIVWILLIGAVVWAALRVAQTSGRGDRDRETAEEILARRFAKGEIDAAAYDEARERLGRGQSR
ncbi:MAG: hypothetical protein K0R62_692 [Nonomuraea muscovyensis]|nr:hypothetical protein [Nonomuraea muscovyensis]